MASRTTGPRRNLVSAAVVPIAAALLLFTSIARATDVVTPVLGTGSVTGTVVAAHPSATGTGHWFQITGALTDTTFVTMQVSAMGTNVIKVQATLDGTNVATLYTFAVDGDMYTVPVCGGCMYRTIVDTYNAGAPIVKATASGAGQVVVR